MYPLAEKEKKKKKQKTKRRVVTKMRRAFQFPHLQDIESGGGHRLVPLPPRFNDLWWYLHGCRYDAGDTSTTSDQNNGTLWEQL